MIRKEEEGEGAATKSDSYSKCKAGGASERARIGPGRIPAVCEADKRPAVAEYTEYTTHEQGLRTVRGTGQGCCLCNQPAQLRAYAGPEGD